MYYSFLTICSKCYEGLELLYKKLSIQLAWLLLYWCTNKCRSIYRGTQSNDEALLQSFFEHQQIVIKYCPILCCTSIKMKKRFGETIIMKLFAKAPLYWNNWKNSFRMQGKIYLGIPKSKLTSLMILHQCQRRVQHYQILQKIAAPQKTKHL